MNAYALVVLAALLLEHALNLTADVLNLRALRPELPPEFADVYDPASYRRSQEYTRARTRFGMLSGTVELATLLAFWGLGGFGWLDELVRSLGLGPVPRARPLARSAKNVARVARLKPKRSSITKVDQ